MNSPKLKNMLKRKQGFSLVEIMVAAGLLSALSVGVMQMNKTMSRGQATAELKMETIELRRQIVSTMASKQSCENTLVGSSLGDNVNAIKNDTNGELFTVGSKYGSNALELESIVVTDVGDLGGGMRDAELKVVFKKLKRSAYGSAQRSFKSRLKVKASGATAPITECYDDSAGIISTANETSCIGIGGVWDSGTNTCTVSQFVKVSGDTMTGGLEAPSLTSSGDIRTINLRATGKVNGPTLNASTSVKSPLFCTGKKCRSIDDLALSNQICPNGKVSEGVKANGRVKCQALQCPSNQFFAGLDNAGKVICRPYPTTTCPTTEYVSQVKPDGTVVCKPLPNNTMATCPNGKVLQSIRGGVPSCVDQVEDTNAFGKMCPEGSALVGIRKNGKAVCKEPELDCTSITSASRFAYCPDGYMATGCSAGFNKASANIGPNYCETHQFIDWTTVRCCKVSL